MDAILRLLRSLCKSLLGSFLDVLPIRFIETYSLGRGVVESFEGSARWLLVQYIIAYVGIDGWLSLSLLSVEVGLLVVLDVSFLYHW